jgi:hypothetical protein
VTFKLGDFGLAKSKDALDANGVFLNAIRPPEAIRHDEFGPLDHKADIYQIGLPPPRTAFPNRFVSRSLM